MILVEVVKLVVHEDRGLHLLIDRDSHFTRCRFYIHITQVSSCEYWSGCVVHILRNATSLSVFATDCGVLIVLDTQLLNLVTHHVEHDSNAQEHNSESAEGDHGRSE